MHTTIVILDVTDDGVCSILAAIITIYFMDFDCGPHAKIEVVFQPIFSKFVMLSNVEILWALSATVPLDRLYVIKWVKDSTEVLKNRSVWKATQKIVKYKWQRTV